MPLHAQTNKGLQLREGYNQGLIWPLRQFLLKKNEMLLAWEADRWHSPLLLCLYCVIFLYTLFGHLVCAIDSSEIQTPSSPVWNSFEVEVNGWEHRAGLSSGQRSPHFSCAYPDAMVSTAPACTWHIFFFASIQICFVPLPAAHPSGQVILCYLPRKTHA